MSSVNRPIISMSTSVTPGDVGRPMIPMVNPLNEDFNNPFFDDYFFTKTAYDQPTSIMPRSGAYAFEKTLYGSPRDISTIDSDGGSIWSRVFSRGKKSSVTTKEINDFLKQEFSVLNQQSSGGAFTFLTSHNMPKNVVSDIDFTSKNMPRSILFTERDMPGVSGHWRIRDRVIAKAAPPVYGQEAIAGMYISENVGETLRHETGHAISDAIEAAIRAQPQGVSYKQARGNVMKRMRSSMSSHMASRRQSQLLAESVETVAGTSFGLHHFDLGNLSGDISKDMRMFGPLKTMSENEKVLVHNLMQANKTTALGGQSFGPELFANFMHGVVEESFADDVAMITAPKLDLEQKMVSGFFQDTAQGVQFIEKPPIRQAAPSAADYISRSITTDFTSVYGRSGGTQWDNYMKSYLGPVMTPQDLTKVAMGGALDIADESGLSYAEKTALRKFATEVYVGSRTGGLASLEEVGNTGARNTVFHLPGIRDVLGAQGYSDNETNSIIEALQKRVTMQQEMFAKGETSELMSLVDIAAPSKLDLTNAQAAIKVADQQTRPMIQLSQTVAQSTTQKKVGTSAAGRKFFSDAVQSAKGSKVVSAAGKAIKSVFV